MTEDIAQSCPVNSEEPPAIWSRAFFFQAEDGIRDGRVTGVQTCALPILAGVLPGLLMGISFMVVVYIYAKRRNYPVFPRPGARELAMVVWQAILPILTPGIIVGGIVEIGRASCRERGEIAVGAGALKKKK